MIKFLVAGFQAGITKTAKEKFRQRVEILARNRAGDILLGKRQRPDGSEYYMFPGGGIDEGESTIGAGKREFQEETGKNIANIQRLGDAIINRYKFDSPKYEGYGGGETAFVTGDIRGGPRPKIFGADQDEIESLKYYSPEEAMRLIDLDDDTVFKVHRARIEAVKRLVDMMENR